MQSAGWLNYPADFTGIRRLLSFIYRQLRVQESPALSWKAVLSRLVQKGA